YRVPYLPDPSRGRRFPPCCSSIVPDRRSPPLVHCCPQRDSSITLRPARCASEEASIPARRNARSCARWYRCRRVGPAESSRGPSNHRASYAYGSNSAIHRGFHCAQFRNHSSADETGLQKFIGVIGALDDLAHAILHAFNIRQKLQLSALKSHGNGGRGFIAV